MVCKRRHGVFVTPPLFPSVTKRLSPWQSTTSCDEGTGGDKAMNRSRGVVVVVWAVAQRDSFSHPTKTLSHTKWPAACRTVSTSTQ